MTLMHDAPAERPADTAAAAVPAPATLTMAQALNRALADALAADPSVVVFGEDVGPLGGVFRITDGLTARFGEDRCFDTPLAEAGIVGTAVGMSMNGMRPVVEMQFDAFAYPAFEQIVDHVAKMGNRTRGAIRLPMVIRIPYAGGIGGVEHHSDSSEAYYVHTPGLTVVSPATPQDAVQQALKAVDPTTSVTVDGTATVAGRDAYELVVAPKQAGSTVGSIRVAVDAANGTPLAFTLTPKGSGTAAVDIAYTSVDFGTPAASTFTFTVPKGAKVTQGTDSPSAGLPGLGLSVNRSGARTLGSGWTSVLELKQAAGPAAGAKSGAVTNGPVKGAVTNGPMRTGGAAGAPGLPSLMGSLGHQVHGAFGSGTVVSTRLVNVLITDNGTVFVGAVTESGLIQAADSAAAR